MTHMEIIQIRVPSELARRLRSHQSELPRILERGLYYVEKETGAKTSKASAPEGVTLQMHVIATLRRAGVVGSDPEDVAQYLAEREGQHWMPIKAGGKPASEMIIEERESRPWARW